MRLDDADGRHRPSSEAARQLVTAYISAHSGEAPEVWDVTAEQLCEVVADLVHAGDAAELWRMIEALTFVAAAGWETLSETTLGDPSVAFPIFCEAVELSGTTGYRYTPAERQEV